MTFSEGIKLTLLSTRRVSVPAGRGHRSRERGDMDNRFIVVIRDAGVSGRWLWVWSVFHDVESLWTRSVISETEIPVRVRVSVTSSHLTVLFLLLLMEGMRSRESSVVAIVVCRSFR